MNNDTIAHVAGQLASGSQDWMSTNAASRTAYLNAAVDAARSIVHSTENRAWQTISGQPTGLAAKIRALPTAVNDVGARVVNHADLLRILEEGNV